MLQPAAFWLAMFLQCALCLLSRPCLKSCSCRATLHDQHSMQAEGSAERVQATLSMSAWPKWLQLPVLQPAAFSFTLHLLSRPCFHGCSWLTQPAQHALQHALQYAKASWKIASHPVHARPKWLQLQLLEPAASSLALVPQRALRFHTDLVSVAAATGQFCTASMTAGKGLLPGHRSL